MTATTAAHSGAVAASLAARVALISCMGAWAADTAHVAARTACVAVPVSLIAGAAPMSARARIITHVAHVTTSVTPAGLAGIVSELASSIPSIALSKHQGGGAEDEGGSEHCGSKPFPFVLHVLSPTANRFNYAQIPSFQESTRGMHQVVAGQNGSNARLNLSSGPASPCPCRRLASRRQGAEVNNPNSSMIQCKTNQRIRSVHHDAHHCAHHRARPYFHDGIP
ncbi:hypothetical protein DSTSK_30700 [Desulforhabdus sp. TSK]|nr:hypothetical protein DSTSK_30700 [Desulforhabdus sp. TSK]